MDVLLLEAGEDTVQFFTGECKQWVYVELDKLHEMDFILCYIHTYCVKKKD